MILAREIRDQLRDRRTLFMIAVLPILLYPLLGISLLQVAQFMQEQPTRVLVVGAEKLRRLAGAVREGGGSAAVGSWSRAGRGSWSLFLPGEPRTDRAASDSRARRLVDREGRLRRGAVLSSRFLGPAGGLPRGRGPPSAEGQVSNTSKQQTGRPMLRRSAFPAPKSSATPPATSRGSPRPISPRCSGDGPNRSATRT